MPGHVRFRASVVRESERGESAHAQRANAAPSACTSPSLPPTRIRSMSARLGREGFDVSPEREQPEPAAGEKLLLERVRQGDLAAMDELLSRHERDVYR